MRNSIERRVRRLETGLAQGSPVEIKIEPGMTAIEASQAYLEMIRNSPRTSRTVRRSGGLPGVDPITAYKRLCA